ncbi:hypothetical protein CC86DRAFT_375891 [Ophiobolus disseminans]|uniref:DUF7924 domain-containing protein n=1 Tax=Ophiobolus disseminans TaxID=1469910 RepID=A0A6A6ZC49_9PLEO|nr:hypothetical protein CC86DRAFT_375891 [Ophiobolus disseminans]
MLKRKRSASTADLPPTKLRACITPPRSPPFLAVAELQWLPLTLDNLAQHTLRSTPPAPPAHTSSPPMSSRSGSPTRRAWDDRATLRSYRILVDAARAPPTQLKRHLDTVLLSTRDGPRSPNAKQIVSQRLAASLENESTGIYKLEPLLLFAGEDDPHTLNGVSMISKKLNTNLSRDFLPHTPPGKSLRALSQPQPDTIIGYLSNNQASATEPPLATAFSADEEEALANFTLNPVLLFPFLTSQWKPASGESHMIAHAQSARDGATIVRYLDEFYTIARGQPPTELECSHISVTCDIQTVNIWLHWRELDSAGGAEYYMKSIHDCTLRNEQGLMEARALLKNHIAFALGGRLQSLKQALDLFSDEATKTKMKAAKSGSSASHTVRTDSTHIAPISLPPTPSSEYAGRDPGKKRPRLEEDGSAG